MEPDIETMDRRVFLLASLPATFHLLRAISNAVDPKPKKLEINWVDSYRCTLDLLEK